MFENAKIVIHVLVLWLATLLTIVSLFIVSPIFLISWILCRFIGREFKLSINLKAELIEKGVNHEYL